MRWGTQAAVAACLAISALMSCGAGNSAARVQAARTKIDQLIVALKAYKRDVGSYPSASQGLMALVEKPAGADNWKGPYLEGGTLSMDPWGHQFFYVDSGPYVGSYGSDGMPGGDGAKTDLMSKIVEQQ